MASGKLTGRMNLKQGRLMMLYPNQRQAQQAARLARIMGQPQARAVVTRHGWIVVLY